MIFGNDKIVFTKHARKRMLARQIEETSVRGVVNAGSVVFVGLGYRGARVAHYRIEDFVAVVSHEPGGVKNVITAYELKKKSGAGVDFGRSGVIWEG